MLPFPSSRLPFTLNLWISARLLPQVMKRRQLDDILLRATPPSGVSAYVQMTPEAVVDAVKRTVANPWRMRGRRCLREGLLAFHYLSLAGHRPVLHFGIVPSSMKTARPRAHCWVSVGGATVLNPPLEPMLDLFSYDGEAALPANSVTLLAGAAHD
jgi:hypothetical protein